MPGIRREETGPAEHTLADAERPSTMSDVILRLYGALRLEEDGKCHLIKGRKNGQLLAYLAMCHDQLIARDELAGTLWPESDQEHAHKSLSHALSELRKILDRSVPGAVEAERDTVILRTGELVVDVVAIERLLSLGDPGSVEASLDLASGELLAGMDGGWVLAERERLGRALREAGVRAGSDLIAQGDTPRAFELAQRLLRRDGADEEAHQLLFRVYAERRDRCGLMRQYQSCERAVRAEFDAEPAAETVRVYRASLADM